MPYSSTFNETFKAVFPKETELHKLLQKEKLTAADIYAIGQPIIERRREAMQIRSQDREPDAQREIGYASLFSQWETESKDMQQKSGPAR